MAEVRLRIGGMSCASCSAHVERALRAVPGVDRAIVNLATHEARVSGSGHIPLLGLLETVHKTGYTAEPLLDNEDASQPEAAAEDTAVLRRDLRLAAAVSLVLMALAMFGPQGIVWGVVQGLLATAVMVGPGRRFFTKAWLLLRHRTTAMETLIALGVLAAWSASWVSLPAGGHVYFESAATIITLILLGRVLESGAKDRAAQSLRELSRLLPSTALLVDDDDEEREVQISTLTPGDRVRVRSGSQLPTDGVIIRGEGSVDESMLTGESRFVRRAVGDRVTGASLLQDGFLEVRVTAVGESTVLAGIVRLVRDAQATKAPVQRLADKVAGIFVPIVLGLALLTVVLHVLLAPQMSIVQVLMRAAAVLVIACPCALGLATPTAILVGSGTAARHGILFRDAASLELLHEVSCLAMDKTGTLTRGKPEIARFEPIGMSATPALFSAIAAAENSVEHPLAAAIRDYCRERSEGSAFALSVVTRPGGGLRAEVAGKEILVGAEWYLKSEGIAVEDGRTAIAELEADGLSTVLVARDGSLVAVFGLEDRLRPEVPALVHRLIELGIEPILLSGDRPEAVHRAAQQAGIERREAAQRPEDKARRIREIAASGRRVAMLGDGVNDAPALAAADVGIALASGTEVAIATAPVTLVHGNLGRVIDAIRLSRSTLRTIRQNLFWAFFYNCLAIPLAAFGVLNPMIAAAAMAASSIFVVANSLRLRSFDFRSN